MYAGFDSVELTKPQRSTFDHSHFRRMTCQQGRLTPVLVKECIPGDTWHGSSDILLRLAPLQAPIYDQIELYVHFWFTPNRLLWEDWEEFITGGRLGVGTDPVTAPIPPYVDIGEIIGGNPNFFEKGSLPDNFGVPMLGIGVLMGDYTGIHMDMMPFAAYTLIYYEFYRDRNFVADEEWWPMVSGNQSGLNNMLSHRYRSYRHDYFTSALPFTQRGEEVLMPVSLAGVAPLYADPLAGITSLTMNATGQPGSVAQGYQVSLQTVTGMDGKLFVRGEDISGASTTINDFRSAYALQVWLERNAIGGSRYTESTQAHFGVRPQDSRLQRPEYIGGGRIPVKISEVVSTSYSVDEADAVVPLAALGGHGITYGDTNQFHYFCAEHGFIIGLVSIMCPPSYHQGMPNMFRRRSFLDYPWPTFAKLGEQPVDKAEIFANVSNMTEDSEGNRPLFGYQSRYADWKYTPSTNHGDFHDVLLHWTGTRDFASSPELGYLFNLFDGSTLDRMFVASGLGLPKFLLYIHNRLEVQRALPYHGRPNTLGFV